MTIARFAVSIVLALVAAFLIVASLVFGASVASWLLFGVALGVLVAVGLAQLDRDAGIAEHVPDALTGTLAIWATVASVVFVGATVAWRSFAEAVGLAALAGAGAGVAAYKLMRRRMRSTTSAASLDEGRPAEDLRAVA